MKNLIILIHSHYHGSVANKAIMEGLKEMNLEHLTIKENLYDSYPNFEIDLEKEKAALLQHDRIILQFPIQWYGTPALLKKWIDVVLAYNFAYANDRKDDSKFQLKDKKLLLSITTGNNASVYSSEGLNLYTIEDFLKPLEVTFKFCKMEFEKPIISHGMKPSRSKEEFDKEIQKHLSQLKEKIQNI